MEDRKIVLLKAALAMLEQEQYSIVNTVYYDDAECDVFCLIEDIKIELNIEE